MSQTSRCCSLFSLVRPRAARTPHYSSKLDSHTFGPISGTDKRQDFNSLATVAQFSLVSVFLCGSFIKLIEISSGDDADVFRVVVIMICFNFAVVTLYVIIAAYHMSTIEALPSILLKATREPPSLALPHKHHKFHLFLSHVWSSGQVRFSP